MTEKTLEKAIEIKHNIDRLKKIKNELENANNLCWGNTRELEERRFDLQMSEGGCYIKSVKISSEAAKNAIEYEITKVNEALKKYLNELSELN